MEQEHANLRAALGWLVERGAAEQGLRLAYLLAELWFEERHTSEGRAWLAALLALPQAATRTATRAEALDLAGALALAQDDYVAARSLQEEGLTIFRELGDRARLGYALLHLGHVVGYGQRDFATARALYQEALELLRDLDHQEGIAHALAGLASVALEMGDYATAHPLVQESLQRYRALGFVWDMALSLGRAAGVAAGTGHPERALRLAGAASAQQDAIGVSLPPVFQDRFKYMLAPARQALDAATQAAAWEQGRTMTLEQAVAYALEEPAQ